MRAEWLASSQLHNREEVVNKAELIEALAVRLGDRKTATAALDAVLAEVQAAVTKGEKVAITGFGAFEKRVRGARTARNPRTGEAVKVKKTSVPTFRPGAGFKEMVASGKVPKATAAAKKTTAAAKTTGAKATGAKATGAKATGAKATGAKATAAAKKTTAKKTAAKATKTTAATKTASKKAAPARKTAAAGRTAAAKKTAASKSTTAKKAPAKKAPAKKAATRR
ncbi:HU family DNA-binding protein [Micromonospora globbae]|uniref:HU family DNA-binding protein n=1 Tax=Micromonospora globbae TaxID=1894969 RepID=A0A420F2L2_9ACTN|nr:HU family DNA-binding protein [Micromonospora globbae]RKF27203.1 HU family DNA-binding protein [Micromonospora globbae]